MAGIYRDSEVLSVTAQTLGQRLKIFCNLHLWVVLVMFAVCIVLHYPQQILSTDSPSLFSFLGLTRHAVERILFLLPIGYATFIFGTTAGLISLAIAAIIMLPRVFLISQYFGDALFETAGVILVGGLMILWFDRYRKERERRQQILSKLEIADQQLQSVFQMTRRNEERLWALNEISAILSQSLELDEILKAAAEEIKQVMSLDIVLIFLLNRDNDNLRVSVHLGVKKELVSALNGLRIDESFVGRVFRTGKTNLIEDVNGDRGLISEIEKRAGIYAGIAVSLRAKGNVVGALVGAMHTPRQFPAEEVELLTTIGGQIGMAIENASCYQRECIAAEMALASEKRHREIFENAHDAIWVHDMEGNIITVNKAAEELTGYSSKELLGMNVKNFLTEGSLGLAGQVRHNLFSGKTVEQPYEQHITRRDGAEAILKLSTSLIREDGKPRGFQNIARDVTREKEMQDKLSTAYRELSESHQRLKESQQQLIQAEKLTSLGQLAASIAHEVNNPLSGILTYTQLLSKKIKSGNVDNEIFLSYLAKMEAELIRSTKLIRNLLDFARQSPPAFRQVNLNDIVNRAFDLTSHAAVLQHVHVNKELDAALPNLMADFDQLQQVCTNLILNAIQAMPKGGTLTIRTTADKTHLKLEVQDTGCGISKESMTKLFTPFFTTKREVKGVGLGLAVSYGIIQRHNGKIEVQSKEGEGATFTIYLPLQIEKLAEKS
jgi:PAS domain S-box-containing protein